MDITMQKQQILNELHLIEANIYRLIEQSKKLNTVLSVLESLDKQQQSSVKETKEINLTQNS